MESHADALDFGLPTEAFGQTESLTRRLRHILGRSSEQYMWCSLVSALTDPIIAWIPIGRAVP